MPNHRKIARNVLWNWAGMAVSLATGFVVAPFLVQRLGQTGYGLWILIASLTGYFGLLDLGVRHSVGRNMAFHRARNEPDQVSAVLSTALALLLLPALLGLVCTGVALVAFFRLFDVPAEFVPDTRLALLLVGLNLVLMIALNVFDAALWSCQRFDLLNAIDIPAALLRLVLTYALIAGPHDLPTLAVITLLTTVLAAGAKAWLSFRTDPTLRLVPRLVTAEAARGLLGFGIWSWLLAVARMVTNQLGPILLGCRLGVEWVAPFSVAARLVGYMASLMIAAAGVLTPVATALHAENRRAEQQRLVLLGGKYCLALALFFLAGCIFLGQAFLGLWMGPSLASAYPLLLVLATGEALALSQWVSNSMILGQGRHRALALAGVVENAVAIVLALCLIDSFGPLGICLALALPACACRGVFQLVYICRSVELPLGRYLLEALLPGVGAALLPALGLAVLTAWHTPTNWGELLLQGAVFGVLAGASCCLMFGPQGRLAVLARVPWLRRQPVRV